LKTFTVKAKSFAELFLKIWDEDIKSQKILDDLTKAKEDEKSKEN
jgi:hypothetical protein